MTIEQRATTSTLVADPTSPTPGTPVDSPEVKEPIPIPTDEEVLEHGLYYYWLPEREKVLYRAALATEGLRQEIAAVRTTIGYVLLTNPANTAMILKAISLLERLIRTNYSLFDKGEQPEGAQTPKNQAPEKPSPNSEEHIPRSVRREMAREEAKKIFSR